MGYCLIPKPLAKPPPASAYGSGGSSGDGHTAEVIDADRVQPDLETDVDEEEEADEEAVVEEAPPPWKKQHRRGPGL